MSEYFESCHDVSVVIRKGECDSWANIRTPGYPDGSVKNSLDAEELEEVAEMLLDAAEELK